MYTSIVRPVDDLKLKQTIKLLCTTGIRQPLTMERVKTWLNQFSVGQEQTLALLILRHLIYRTSNQIESALEQALRRAALYFVPMHLGKEDVNWRKVLTENVNGLDFFFGPPAHEFTQPGKSGELIARLLKSNFQIQSSQIQYPDMVTVLKENERYLLIDDGTFTGEQLDSFITQRGQFMNTPGQAGIVVALAHERALTELAKSHANLPVFFGEKITSSDGLPSLSARWIEEGSWPYDEISPLNLYLEIVKTKACFNKVEPLGFGGLGLLVAYEHGIPDDSLQLLWDKSDTWAPLFNR